MKTRVQQIRDIGDRLFADKLPILSLWQAIAEQFNPMRADYTYTRSIGMEFASNLMTGYPAMANRDLANAISAMLRPPGTMWFHPRTTSDRVNRDAGARTWLDNKGAIMMNAMIDNRSGWSRATKEADRDFVSIGNACIAIRPNFMMDGLLYRTEHMRDVAFAMDPAGQVNSIHVKRQITNINLKKLFPDKLSPLVEKDIEKNPQSLVQCRHVVLPTDDYDSYESKNEVAPGGETKTNRKKLPFTSLWVDVDHDFIMEEIGQWQLGYIAPRWDTSAGFGYGYSPSSTINISDARMLQQITLTLLEAGQKAVDPPLKAVGEMIQGGVNAFAGGITWVDAEYDERTGAALQPLIASNPDLGWGVDREKRICELIAQGHFLNQIKLPDTTHARTAFEVQKLWEEFIRNTTPLFEPIQAEYNGAMCERSFEMLYRMKAFGNLDDMPEILQDQSIRFTFESPLTLAASRANAQAFTQALQITQGAVAVDPDVVHDFDVDTAFRDAMEGTGAPANWLVPAAQADKTKALAKQQRIQQQAMQQTMGAVDQGATTATKIGQAATTLQQGGMLPPQQPQAGGVV